MGEGSSFGLVMGGGGMVGVAWEAGLVAGLAGAGLDLARADQLVGTSAGSMIASLLLSGVGADELIDRALGRNAGRTTAKGDAAAEATAPDVPKLIEIFGLWSSAEVLDEGVRSRIGQLALEARTPPESNFLGWLDGLLPDSTWSPRLRITAVDAHSGAFEVLTNESGMALERAIAASCSVPGIFSPVTIGQRQLIDGGVRSGTNADLLVDEQLRLVIMVAPLSDPNAKGIGPIMHRCMVAETQMLEAAGARVHAIAPDDADRAAFGPNMMDPERAEPALEAGRARGRREATRLLELLDH